MVARRLNYSGLVIAGIGFFLTRFTVALALYTNPYQFVLAGVVPLGLGLGLAAFGVALTVADVDPTVVRTTAVWCVVGTGTMLGLALLTLLGSQPTGVVDLSTLRSRPSLSTFLIGGSIGGTLTGVYAARNRHQRVRLEQHANRLEVLNRMLRHEILNAVTAIRGYATLDSREHPDARQVIEDRTADIERTIAETKHLVRHAGQRPAAGLSVDLEDCLETSVATVQDRHPGTTVPVSAPDAALAVRADDRLSRVIEQLLDNAVVHGGDDAPAIDVTATGTRVHVSVSDSGPGLPAAQQALLETGDIGEFDDPKSGFGLNIVRLVVEGVGGSIDTTVDGSGTTITVSLPRVEPETAGPGPRQADFAGVRPATPHMVVALGAALLAGVAYGVTSEALGGSVAGIGVFYGTADPLVGWTTHEFHSVVFGFVFVGLVALVPARYRGSLATFVAVGLGWALALWLGAAGLIAPLWLRLLGIPAAIPSLSWSLLASHLVWGLSLGLLTAWGYASLIPWVGERWAQVSARL